MKLRKIGYEEGFDAGLEMSGSDAAFRDIVDNMWHGGKLLCLEFKT